MNAVVTFPNPAETMLAEQFRAVGVTDPARLEAFKAFAAAGLPHRRVEAWHYTDLRGLLRDALPPAPRPDHGALDAARAHVAGLPPAAARIVLVDGHLVPDLGTLAALPSGVAVAPSFEASGDLVSAAALGAPESIVSLNTAFAPSGVAVTVAAGTRVEGRVEILSLVSGAAPAALYTRASVTLGAGADLTLVERHAALGPGRSQGNHVLVLALSDGAALRHVARIDGLGAEALHLGTTLVRLGAKADFTGTTLVATRGVTRRQAYLEFAGPHARAHFNGASLLDGRAHADTTLVVTHTAPHCESRELYKHVLDGEATGVYQGKVIVAPGAQKTDGKMLSKAVFLGEGATMHNKPELEIFADDVVCGHGATVGALDEDQLFYLRARGIPRSEAEAMLLEAFADEALDEVADEALHDEFAERITLWLRQRGR